MCGIAGWISTEQNLLEHRSIIHKMTDALIHRGPDDYGYYYRENALLGHRRLIVIDPQGGKQPMTKVIGNNEYTIVYNGELYNTEEIKNTLTQKGHIFSTHSDTEVVLTAYIEWREESVLHLNGIFAFGIWENNSKTLYLARDRLGVKPLFYSKIGQNFIFGSEIKALLHFPEVEPIIDEQGLLELFSLGPSRCLGSAVFKNIYELQPSEYLILKPEHMIKKLYWEPRTEYHVESVSSTIEHIQWLVKDAIIRQLVSDVPICTFLSGGLDSSGISSIASSHFKQEDKILNTYSIDYEDNEKYFRANDFQPTSDSMWVNRVSDYIQSKHNKVVVDTETLAKMLEDAVLAKDLPGMADIDSSLMFFCEAVKKDHTVALSGECADEIFGGYPWYRREEDVYYDGFPWNRHMDVRKSFLSQNLSRLKLEDFSRHQYQDTIKNIEFLEQESEHERRIRMMTYLNLKWFMLTLLNRKDRMSMYKSLEVRVPYADHRIVEYAWNIPWSIKYYKDIEKGMLRQALSQFLPTDVVFRKKSPYPKTFNPKYESLIKNMLQEIIDKKDSPIHYLINTQKVKTIIENKQDMFHTPWFGQLMKGPQFLAYLIQLNLWLEHYQVKIQF